MNACIAAVCNGDYSVSAYAAVVDGMDPIARRGRGWTVSGAGIHGLLDLSQAIIKAGIYSGCGEINLVTPIGIVRKMGDSRFIDDSSLSGEAWAVHGSLIREWLFHLEFYRERSVIWHSSDRARDPVVSVYNGLVDLAGRVL